MGTVHTHFPSCLGADGVTPCIQGMPTRLVYRPSDSSWQRRGEVERVSSRLIQPLGSILVAGPKAQAAVEAPA
eukprot:3859939-Pyramimonas_sp.AAC.1